MEEEKRRGRVPGRYLSPGGRRRRPPGQWIRVAVLVVWDGLLLYMILECLIEPVYGAAFASAISVYLGYQL